MAAKAFSWRVIGITPAALDSSPSRLYHQRQGITSICGQFDAVRKSCQISPFLEKILLDLARQ
jgi:hypothetical protein